MKKGFTLAEVLITLAIIGVVAAVSIPSVISNSNQQQYKTGLRKAISVLNSAITMNIALDGESPYDNGDLFNYLQRHMSVMQTLSNLKEKYYVRASKTNNAGWLNSVFYTTDGMRFEFYLNGSTTHNIYPLYEDNTVKACVGGPHPTTPGKFSCGGCGSYGLRNNIDETIKPPCMIMVDVNGDRKPNPANVNCKSDACSEPYKFADPEGIRLTDLFSVLITDKQAIPYGTAAQRAMYSGQTRKNK